MKTIAYASHSPDSPLVPYSFERRELRDNDVAMEVLYCGCLPFRYAHVP